LEKVVNFRFETKMKMDNFQKNRLKIYLKWKTLRFVPSIFNTWLKGMGGGPNVARYCPSNTLAWPKKG
jgi:hypothetical protein